MSSSSITNPSPKRRKIEHKTETQISNWKTESQQQIYSKHLIAALRRSRRDTSSSPPSSAVRLAADRALAAAAKGRTRWSRAILTRRLKLAQINKTHKKTKSKVTGNRRLSKRGRNKKLPAVKVLSRLVPGCSKLSFPNLLEEASDYIAALEMQVRAMSALAGLLTGSTDRVGSNVS